MTKQPEQEFITLKLDVSKAPELDLTHPSHNIIQEGSPEDPINEIKITYTSEEYFRVKTCVEACDGFSTELLIGMRQPLHIIAQDNLLIMQFLDELENYLSQGLISEAHLTLNRLFSKIRSRNNGGIK